jgi:putative DNA primase/helicase
MEADDNGARPPMTFPDFLRERGIIPPESFTEGRWQRCATITKPKGKTANVKLCADGKAGFAIDFAAMTEAEVWRSGIKSKGRDFAAENARRSEELALRAAEEAEGIRRAVKRWEGATGLVGAAHPYCERKRLVMRGMMGLRVASDGALLVPMWRDGEIVSVQAIYEDGTKKFAYGPSSKLCHFWIDRDDAPITVITEGFATGVTIFEALPTAQVCVCFSAANMIAVAQKLDWKGLCIVAGDNDHKQPCPFCQKNGEHLQNPPTATRPEQCRCNPGHSAAVEAAKAIGCGVAIPPAGENITDFNDWFCELLAAKEKAAEGEKWGASPMRLRSAALAPIGNALMRAARMAQVK